MTTTQQVKDAKVKRLLDLTPTYAQQLMSEMEGTSFKWRSSQKFMEFYNSLDDDDPRKTAIEELAKKGLTSDSSDAVVKKAIKEAIAVAKTQTGDASGEIGKTGNREDVRAELQDQRTIAEQQTVGASRSLTADERLDSVLDLAAYSVIQFEGFRVNSYKDVTGPAVAFGNHIHPDGTPVENGDRVTSAEQAAPYFKAHFNNFIRGKLKKALPIEKMTDQEIVMMTSICYNCGDGILSGDFAKKARAYFNNRKDPRAKAAFEYAYKKKCTKRGDPRPYEPLVTRRNAEWKILTGEYIITIDPKVQTRGNVINIKTKPTGILNFIGEKNLSAEKCQKLIEGRSCVNDSIEYVINEALKNESTPNKQTKGRGR